MERLHCTIQEYAWGDTESIPHLLGVAADGRPKAELWMGAHPSASSTLGTGRPLSDAIAEDPDGMLGRATSERFGALPFLFKVLAAAGPLSIQSHPTLEQAQRGFARENDAGIRLDAPDRVYRDPNHKPELICALTPFHAKCGFRPIADARRLFSLLVSAGEDRWLKPVTELLFAAEPPDEIYRRVLAHLLGSGDEDQRAIAESTVDAAAAVLGAAGEVAQPFVPDLDWTARIADAFGGDVGVTVALLLNHVVLEPGEAVFLAAGNLHAYLSGVGMEVMANSDNVVRGGLTPKHRDVDELLRIVDCSPLEVPIQRPETDTWTYQAPVPEFALDRIVQPDHRHRPTGPEIIFVQHGTVRLASDTTRGLVAGPGQVVWIPASEGAYALQGDAALWRARVPDQLRSSP